MNPCRDAGLPGSALRLNVLSSSLAAASLSSACKFWGPSGAAAELGIPPSTLDSKIRTLKIDKYRFKSS